MCPDTQQKKGLNTNRTIAPYASGSHDRPLFATGVPASPSDILFDSSPESFHSHLSDGEDGMMGGSSVSTPASTSSAKQVRKKKSGKKKVKDPDRTPRPPNSWLIYRSQKIQTLDRHLAEKPQAEISKLIAAMWRNESPQVKQHYADQAEIRKQEHRQMYPSYRFTPLRKGVRAASSKPPPPSPPFVTAPLERPKIERSSSSPGNLQAPPRRRARTVSGLSTTWHPPPEPAYPPSRASSSSLGLMLGQHAPPLEHQGFETSSYPPPPQYDTYNTPFEPHPDEQQHASTSYHWPPHHYPEPTMHHHPDAAMVDHHAPIPSDPVEQAWHGVNVATERIWHDPPEPSPAQFFTPLSAPAATSYFSREVLGSYEYYSHQETFPSPTVSEPTEDEVMQSPYYAASPFPFSPPSHAADYQHPPNPSLSQADSAAWQATSPEPSDFLLPELPEREQYGAWDRTPTQSTETATFPSRSTYAAAAPRATDETSYRFPDDRLPDPQ